MVGVLGEGTEGSGVGVLQLKINRIPAQNY